MTVTAEQAEQARAIILDCLNIHHEYQVPFLEVWTRPTVDFDDVPFLEVWVSYDGKPEILDVGKLNSFDRFLMTHLRKAGINALTAISYIPKQNIAQLGTPWTQQD